MKHKENIEEKQVKKDFGVDATLTQATMFDHEAQNQLRKIGKLLNPKEKYAGSICLHFYTSSNVLTHLQNSVSFLDMLVGEKEGMGLAASISEYIANMGVKMLAKSTMQHYKSNPPAEGKE